ncbi:MAG: hypothetical protein AAGG47_14535 [Pseudomonadota bacterium]
MISKTAIQLPYRPDETLFDIPGFGVLRATAFHREGVTLTLPEGVAEPDWLSLTSARLVITRARQEAHRFFCGWEEFFFTVDNLLYSKSVGEVAGLALSGERIDPVHSNARFVLDSVRNNSRWNHGDVFQPLSRRS